MVDTGVPGQLDALRGEIEKADVDFESISRIILTHQDIDHIGGLPEILRARGEEEIEVLAHEEDKPYIEGDKPLIKMNRERMAQMVESLPESQRQQLQRILSRGCYELAQEWLANAENGGPAGNRAKRVIRISMRFFSQVHNSL